MNKRVILGMSGGVDSCVACHLLLKEGYEVIGVTMNLVPKGHLYDEEKGCCSLSSVMDAKIVAEAMGVKHYTMSFREEFDRKIIENFVREYSLGYTPNPCVACNKYIKFDLFVKEAKKLGADYIATGHYARLIDGKLAKAVDKNKDQSYFLAYVNKDIFKDVLFPLGEIEKPEVRKIASEYGLVTASKKDSTGICFIGERNFTQFLENYLPNIPGDIVNIDTGEILGKHIGLMYYTIGQRRGLNIGGTKDRTFVVKKDLDKNILYVAVGDDNKYLYSSTAIIEEFNYLTDKRPSKCTCKFRYRQSDIDINVKYLDNNNLLLSYKGSKAVTPGQFCVLYDKDICLGGGIIKEVK